MIRYDYKCPACEQIDEVFHSMMENPDITCQSCLIKMERMISYGSYLITGGIKGSLTDRKESEHSKKVKDPERAVRSRQKAFGRDAVGDPSMQTDPRHIVKRGRTIGGQQTEVDKAEFIKAAAKDDAMVNQAIKVVEKSGK
ncbi:MAG: FmdB family zinc ribbon protein [Promethearchaeota archaeon]|jgi:putative FmdB family regulatory protein